MDNDISALNERISVLEHKVRELSRQLKISNERNNSLGKIIVDIKESNVKIMKEFNIYEEGVNL